MPIENLQDWSELQAVASMHTVSAANVYRIINAYQRYVSNSYVCPSCPGAISNALRSVKAYAEKHRAEWDLKQAEQDVQDFKAGD